MGAVEGSAHEEVRRVLRALADLSPSSEAKGTSLVVPTEWFHWLPVYAVRLFWRLEQMTERTPPPLPIPLDRRLADELWAVDEIRPEERNLRLGFLFLAGRTTDAEGKARRILRPLVTMPVRVQRASALTGAKLVAAGDAEVTDLISDRAVANRFEADLHFGGGAFDTLDDVAVPPALLGRLPRLHQFAEELAAAAGYPVARVVGATKGPEQLLRTATDLAVVAGAAVYVTHETGGTSRAGSLRAWAAGPLRAPTALHAVYGLTADDDAGGAGDESDAGRIRSPFRLTATQRQAVARTRHEPVTVVSGAPGTGKSHTVTAIACDALARGERVLVAAKSDATVDALLDLLERSPGPDPVVFGSNERRDALAQRLAGGQSQVVTRSAVAEARRRFEQAAARYEAQRSELVDLLGAEASLDGAAMEEPARVLAPALFDPDTDLAHVARVLADAVPPAGAGILRRWSAGRAAAKLRRACAAPPGASPVDLGRAVDAARSAATRRRLLADGGLDPAAAWAALAAAEDEAADAHARWLAADSRSDERLNRSTLPIVAALATGLRSGRAARRELLRRLDDEALTRALPLWIGSLPDIDDLLPPIAGLFDLVILDEASSIDQPTAAPALLRGRRAVVVGDPRQLRHVSFLSDGQLERTMAAHGIDEPALAARLDVRRNSAFDVAAGAAATTVLDEHFRAAPHLVSFVFARLYGGGVSIATRSLQNEARDCVELHRLQGSRNADGVVEVEVRRVIRELKSRLRDASCRSVGVVSPFRAQADAIEAAVLAELGADGIEALDLRVGTVHSFQGNERELVIVSMGVGEGAPAASWRFVEDPHLFAVLATRARRQLVLLVSGTPPAHGLLADYLAQADAPPSRAEPARPLEPWATAVADHLEAAGLEVRRSYPTGRHVVDVALLDHRRTSVAVECGVHRDGPEAHVERHLALRRAGWQVLSAHRSRWEERPGELVIELARTVGASPRT